MSTNRNYNKLYIKKNDELGSEQLVLGYQSNLTELILEKDKTTPFFVPFFVPAFNLKDSKLIESGAFGGSFPAASDRIYKNENVNLDKFKGNGSVWFCSWLHKTPEGKTEWMDRFYSGSGSTSALDFATYNTVFVDLPTKMIIEPGVLYKYYHVGENSFASLVSTLGGLSGQHLKMNLTDWESEQTDTATESNVQVSIITSAPKELLYKRINYSNKIDKSQINFDNGYDITANIEFGSNLKLEQEFSYCFWAYNKNWFEGISTQLFGNFSTNQAGFGLFLETLSSYPFYVIPETTKNKTIFINQESFPYKTLNTTRAFSFIAIDIDNNVYGTNHDNPSVIYKTDHLGNIICTTKTTNFNLNYIDEIPLDLICWDCDNIALITTKAIYYFDHNLVLLNWVNSVNSLSSVNAVKISSVTNKPSLISRSDVFDIKYEKGVEWSISKIDGNLYKNSSIFAELEGKGSTLQIAPDGNIWVLHGNNAVSIFDSTKPFSENVLLQTKIGTNLTHSSKNIGFINKYNRSTQTCEWNAIIYYSNEPSVFVLSVEGNLINTIELKYLFGLIEANSTDIKFGKGDFTGYDFKRIVRQIEPFNKSSQIALKINTQNNKNENTLTKLYHSTVTWDKNSWQHFTLTYKNKILKLYINGKLIAQYEHRGVDRLTSNVYSSWFLGIPTGANNGLNSETKSVSNIFNGSFADVKLFNYALQQEQIEIIREEFSITENIYWHLPSFTTQHIEPIQQVFKHKMPGMKSSFYNVKIAGMNITDLVARNIIESNIKEMISQLSPMYTDLIKVEWV